MAKHDRVGSGVKCMGFKSKLTLAKLLGLFSKGKKRELREQREATSDLAFTLQDPIGERQATSHKRQATSLPQSGGKVWRPLQVMDPTSSRSARAKQKGKK